MHLIKNINELPEKARVALLIEITESGTEESCVYLHIGSGYMPKFEEAGMFTTNGYGVDHYDEDGLPKFVVFSCIGSDDDSEATIDSWFRGSEESDFYHAKDENDIINIAKFKFLDDGSSASADSRQQEDVVAPIRTTSIVSSLAELPSDSVMQLLIDITENKIKSAVVHLCNEDYVPQYKESSMYSNSGYSLDMFDKDGKQHLVLYPNSKSNRNSYETIESWFKSSIVPTKYDDCNTAEEILSVAGFRFLDSDVNLLNKEELYIDGDNSGKEATVITRITDIRTLPDNAQLCLGVSFSKNLLTCPKVFLVKGEYSPSSDASTPFTINGCTIAVCDNANDAQEVYLFNPGSEEYGRVVNTTFESVYQVEKEGTKYYGMKSILEVFDAYGYQINKEEEVVDENHNPFGEVAEVTVEKPVEAPIPEKQEISLAEGTSADVHEEDSDIPDSVDEEDYDCVYDLRAITSLDYLGSDESLMLVSVIKETGIKQAKVFIARGTYGIEGVVPRNVSYNGYAVDVIIEEDEEEEKVPTMVLFEVDNHNLITNVVSFEDCFEVDNPSSILFKCKTSEEVLQVVGFSFMLEKEDGSYEEFPTIKQQEQGQESTVEEPTEQVEEVKVETAVQPQDNTQEEEDSESVFKSMDKCEFNKYTYKEDLRNKKLVHINSLQELEEMKLDYLRHVGVLGILAEDIVSTASFKNNVAEYAEGSAEEIQTVLNKAGEIRVYITTYYPASDYRAASLNGVELFLEREIIDDELVISMVFDIESSSVDYDNFDRYNWFDDIVCNGHEMPSNFGELLDKYNIKFI